MPTGKTAAKKTTRKPAPKTTRKVTLEDVWATIDEIGKAHRETEAALKETQRAHKETEIALKETQRIVGDLGNKFGDEAEYTMLPGLPEKFKHFGFDFGVISRNRKINNDEHDIHCEDNKACFRADRLGLKRAQ
jgi:hypothetical protein